MSMVTAGHRRNVDHQDSDSSSSSTEDNKESCHMRLLKARKRRRIRQYMDDFLKSKDTNLSFLESQAVTGKTEAYYRTEWSGLQAFCLQERLPTTLLPDLDVGILWKLDVGHEMSRGACDDQEASPIQPMAIGLSEDQTSLTSAKQAGRSTSTGPSTQEENQMILQLNRCLQTITLVNNNVEGYINSAFWTVCWAHLLCTQQSIADWKGVNAPFYQMLCEGTHQKLDSKHHHSMAWGMQQ